MASLAGISTHDPPETTVLDSEDVPEEDDELDSEDAAGVWVSVSVVFAVSTGAVAADVVDSGVLAVSGVACSVVV
jgi:hypothetical protein